MKKGFSKTVYILSMILPALLLFICLYYDGIYIGSEKTILLYDMGAQYAPFISLLGKMGDGFNNIMYQSLSGMGGSFFGTWAYYLANPLSFIVLLFDAYKLPDAIYLIVLLKISLCGLTMCLYLKKGHLNISDPVVCIISSCSYALMSYNIMYMILPMWLDGVMMLPLVALGVDHIIEKNKGLFFTVAFTLSVILNYYTAYMIAFFVVIYYFYRIISEKADKKTFLNSFLTISFSSIISIMLSAWLWLPVFIDFKRGKLAESEKDIELFIRNVIGVTRQFFPGSYDGIYPSDEPAIYCGMIFTILLIICFFYKGFSIRKKIAVFGVCAIYYISLCAGFMDVLWHGLKIPNCLPARYSFTFTFFIIVVSSELLCNCFLYLRQNKKAYISYSIISALFIITVFDLLTNSFHFVRSLESDDNTGKRFNRYDYETMVSISDLIISDYYENDRILYSNYEYSSNDGLLFGIPTLDYFSSSYNLSFSAFMRSLGIDYMMNIDDDLGTNTANANILGIGYIAEFNNAFIGTDLMNYATPVLGDDSFRLYKLDHCIDHGFAVPFLNESVSFSYDPFDNINLIYSDITGVDGVFEKCEIEGDRTDSDSSFAFSETFTVTPQNGRHLYVYISPRGFYEDNMTCDDELYLNNELVAKFIDVGNRYIVDMGYSDGSPLSFTYMSKNADSEVYFYTLDYDRLEKAFSSIDPVISNVNSSSHGMIGTLSLENDTDVVFQIPYEEGFVVRIDGKKVLYTDYRGGLIRISVPEGEHDFSIYYLAPGFAYGVIVSILGLTIYLLFFLITRKRSNR